MRARIFISVAATAVALVSGASTVACAQDKGETTASVTVRVAGIDLSSREGAKTALHRIETAADAVCGARPDPRELNRTFYDQCRKAAITDAVARLDQPMVTQLASVQTPPIFVASR